MKWYSWFPSHTKYKHLRGLRASLVAQMVKNLPAMQTQVQSLGWDEPLEEGMLIHSSILTWRILWTEEPGGLQSTGSQRVGHDWVTNTFTLWLYQVLVVACGIFSCNIQTLSCSMFPNQGLNPGPLHWEHRVFATGPPGESPALLGITWVFSS